MTIYGWLIIALWSVLVAYWAVSALSAKRNVRAVSWWREGGLRLSAIVLVLAAFHVPVVHHLLRNAQARTAGSTPMGVIGAVLCLCGIGLAILARGFLGRNWGMPMSRKENPELVTTGPYARIRHPIYTGLLLAMLGSTLGESVFWVLPLLLFGAYFIYSARREERLMLQQFPREYPAYRQRTKMLLPFVL